MAIFGHLGTITPWTRAQVVASFKDKRGPRYARAAESLNTRELCFRSDAKVSAFIKSEKFSPADKVNPDPRMIQARGVRYNLELATFYAL